MSGAERKVRLLTEREWREFWVASCGLPSDSLEKLVRKHRERGLIAEEPEPVDPLEGAVIEACDAAYREVYGDWVPKVDTRYIKAFVRHFRQRGIELGREAARPLTREMVREGLRVLRWSDGDWFVDKLHAALTQQMEGRDTPPEPQP